MIQYDELIQANPKLEDLIISLNNLIAFGEDDLRKDKLSIQNLKKYRDKIRKLRWTMLTVHKHHLVED
jgi:hypothetical protein